MPFHQINSIIIPSVECLNIFVIKNYFEGKTKSMETLKFSPLEINPLFGIIIHVSTETRSFLIDLTVHGHLSHINSSSITCIILLRNTVHSRHL